MLTDVSNGFARRRTIAMLVVALAFVMDILDLTIVNVAIPTIQADLGAGKVAIQWMVAGYATVFAVLLVTGGRLGDIFGYRRMLIGGAAGFTLSSLLCGLAPNGPVLVATRLMQGGAAAMMIPQVMALVQVMYPPHERASALGVFGILGGTAAVAGPIVGGLLIGVDLFGLSWRPIFLVNLPVGLLILACAPIVLPPTRVESARSVDWIGVALMTGGAFGLLFPLIEGDALGWPLWLLALLPLGAAALVLLLAHSRRIERRGATSLMPIALLGDHVYRLGLPVALLFQGATTSLLFVLSIFLQQTLRFSPVETAIVHLPYAVGASVAIGVVARKLVRRFGALLMLGGAALMVACLLVLGAVLAHVSPDRGGVAALAPVMLGLGLGMGLIGGPIAPILLRDVPLAAAGAASGLLKTVQEFGGALGIALVGNLLFRLASGGGRSGIDALIIPTALLVLGGALSLLIVRAISARHED